MQQSIFSRAKASFALALSAVLGSREWVAPSSTAIRSRLPSQLSVTSWANKVGDAHFERGRTPPSGYFWKQDISSPTWRLYKEKAKAYAR